MPLSPTDFYAYSRATGAPVADTPEDRARQAPDVYAFRQSQLQGPQQPDQGGFNVLDALGKTALAAGAIAGGFGLYGRLRSKGFGQAVEGAAVDARAAQAAKVAPDVQKVVRTAAAAGPVPSSPPPQRVVAQVVTEAKPNLGVKMVDLGSVSRAATPESLPIVKISSAPAQDPWQGAATTPNSQSFLTKALQPSEEILDRLAADYENKTAQNIVGQHLGETLVDQHNTEAIQNSYQSASAIGSAEDQITGRSIHALQQNPQVDMSQIEATSGFKTFSQQATKLGDFVKNTRNIADAMWSHEAMLEDLGKQNQALQTARAQGAQQFTAQDLMGTLPRRGTTRTYNLSDFSDSAAQGRANLTHSEIADRIMAAGSATPEEAQLLLNPAIPTSNVRHLLGSTLRGNAATDFHSNPTYEVRSYGQMGPTDAERFYSQRLEKEHGPAAAQEYLAERLGGAGVITGLRERNNPEYDALLHGKLIPHWDELHGAGQLVARNSPVTAEDVRQFNLNPERMHSNMTFNERKQLLDELPDRGGYEGARHRQTGQYLSEYAGYLGLNNVSPTIVEAGYGKPLSESRGFVERTNTGKTFIPGEVQQTEGSAPGSERFERSSEGVIPIRATRSGEESRGVYATNDPNRPFRLVPTEVTGSKLVGGYELPEPTPHFMVGPAVPGGRNATSVAIKDMGQMVPVVHLDNETVPVNRLNQIGLLAPEGRHDPGSDILRIQPYMVGDLVDTEAGTQVVQKPVYGPLMQRTSEGLTPTVLNMGEAKQVAKDASATWKSNPNAKLDYLANTGNQSDIDYLNEHGYEVGQVATGPGTARNVVTGMRVKTDLGKAERDAEGFIIPASVKSNVTPVSELGEPYHQTGYVADQLHQYFNASKKVGTEVIPGVDLPVLQDPSAKHHFVNDLLSVTTERDVHGSPYQGYTQTKVKDPLNVGRYAREWNEEKGGYTTNVIPGMRRQQGLSGVDPMQYEDAGEAANLGTNVAFLTPRINTAPQRAAEIPPGMVLPPKAQPPVGQTSEWNLPRPQQNVSAAPEQANLQQAAARVMASSVPDARQQASVQHLANYISSAAKRVDQPLTWQGNTKLKGVGNNALMPYAPPSEGMIQALMTQARRR